METTEKVKTDFRKEGLMWVAITAPLVLGFYLWNSLPDQMPVHWSIDGTPDNWFPKFWGVTALFLINVFTYIVLFYAPRLDPRKFNARFYNGPYFIIRFSTVVFLSALHIGAILAAAADGRFPMPKIIIPAVFLLFSLLGNYLTTVRSNYFIGIRTPWTLENDEVWKQTHRLAGKLWFWAGLAGMALAFFLDQKQSVFLLIGVVALITLIPAVYSYLLFRRLQQPTG